MTATPYSNASTTITLDMTGAACPVPLLGAKRILDDLPDGRPMVLISDCPGTAGDLDAWAGVTGHEIVASRPLDARRTAYTIRRRLARDATPANRVLDQRDSACPGPILAAKWQLDRMQPGEVLVLLSDCTLAPSDVAVWAENTSVEVLDTFQTRAGHYEYYLRRRATIAETQ
jgi:TusA-related sulfurtransferase